MTLRPKHLLTGVFICSILACSSPQQNTDNTSSLIDVNNISVEQFESSDALLDIISIKGQQRLSVESDKELQASVTIKSSEIAPWDLSTSHQIKAEVSNIGEHKTQVAMYVGLDPDPLMRWYCSNFVDLEPGETKTVTVDLTWLPWVHEPQLDLLKMRGIPGKEKTPRKDVQQVSFSVRYPTSKQHYSINSLYATGTTEVRDTTGFFPFVDTYGQFKHDDWKDKVHNDVELLLIAEREKIELNSNPKSPEVNKYGGWANGPQLKATGFFRTEKIDDKWWMVDPSGCLFWSAGVNCVSNRSTFTGITGRNNYFEGIPPFSDDSEEFYHKRRSRYEENTQEYAFTHYTYNLYRLFGDNYLDDYRELTHKRFASWGLNTIGFVSDQDMAAQQKTPYVGSIWIRGTRKIEGSHGYQGKFHDVFDADFQSIVKECVESQRFGANDPWCLGYYVDNEMSWGAAGSLSTATLISPADQPAKQEFIKDLKAKYTQISALNTVWGSNFESWDALLQNTEAPDEERAKEDLYAFYDKLARQYFKTVHDELAKVAPHQNYMGCRLAWAQNDITLGAAGDYCDIISFNKYEYSVENVGLPTGVDKPIVIGEFHFGSLDRGMFHIGVKWAKDQADRGQKYQDYIQGALRNKQIVGAHWFQYIDEPITGRGDGENYNVGLVNVANVAYPELIEKIRETCYTKYSYRDEH